MAGTQTQRYIALDVECVATGIRHDARAVCFVAVIDNDERLLLKKMVKPTKSIVSYLTPLTGVKQGDLDSGERLEDVIAEVKSLLGPDVVLVGQGVNSDIEWLQLEKGKDFGDVVDLGAMFKVYNSHYGNYSFFSLQHEANTLLRAGFIGRTHDPETDAIASMKLFKTYHGNPSLIEQAKRKLMAVRPPVSFAKANNYEWEGVCQACYYPAKCFCGAPIKSS